MKSVQPFCLRRKGLTHSCLEVSRMRVIRTFSTFENNFRNNLNPSNAEATFIESTRTQKSLKTIYKPCHVGIHFIALVEYFQMSTHMPGFQSILRFCALFCKQRMGQNPKILEGELSVGFCSTLPLQIFSHGCL